MGHLEDIDSLHIFGNKREINAGLRMCGNGSFV